MKNVEFIGEVYNLGWAYNEALHKALLKHFDVFADMRCDRISDNKNHLTVRTRSRKRFKKEEIEAIKNFVIGWNVAIELENL